MTDRELLERVEFFIRHTDGGVLPQTREDLLIDVQARLSRPDPEPWPPEGWEVGYDRIARRTNTWYSKGDRIIVLTPEKK